LRRRAAPRNDDPFQRATRKFEILDSVGACHGATRKAPTC
jgi:hypothetical protein